MKVKNLIDELSRLDQDMVVIVDGYEGGFMDPNVTIINIKEKESQCWYSGKYDDIDNFSMRGSGVKAAVCISRENSEKELIKRLL